MPYIQTARGEFYFADHRHEGQPVLVLVHGAAGSHLDWPLAIRRLGVVAVDLSGHGKSKGEGHESIEEHAADMVALLDALEIERAFICGHSMGGGVTLKMALEYPDRLLAMMLVATGGRLRVRADILSQAEENPEAVAEILFANLWADGTPEAVRERGKQIYLAQNPRVVARDYRASNAFDVLDELGAIRLPALVMSGTVDTMTPLRYNQHLADHIPGAEIHIYEGAGHNLQLERAEAVAADMATFMRRVQRR